MILEIILLMLLKLLYLQCGVNEQDEFAYNYNFEDYLNYEEILSVDRSLGNLQIQVAHSYIDEEEYKDEVKIFISNLDSDGLFILEDVIDVEYETGMAWDVRECLFIEDVNFDDSLDIIINLGHFGNQGVNIYAVYLNDNGVFSIAEDYFMIQNLSIDYGTELILAHWRNNASSHGHGMFKVENDILVIYKTLNIYWKEYDTEVNGEKYFIDKYVVEEFDNDDLINETIYMSDMYSEKEISNMFLNENSEWGIYTGKWKTLADQK